jgi:hypothetical protein
MNRLPRRLTGALVAVLLPWGGMPGPALASTPVTGTAAGLEPLRLAVRTGDPAPVAARLRGPFHCGPAAVAAGTALVDGSGRSLFVRDAFDLRAVAHAGDATETGETLRALGCPVGGLDGGLSAPAVLADDRDAIVVIDAGAGAPPRALLAAGTVIDLRDGPAAVTFLWGHAADTEGAAILPVSLDTGATALVRVEADGDVEVLAQPGDPLGPGRIAFVAGARPAVNRSGTVAFAAALQTGESAVATLRPGETPIVLFLASPAALQALAPQGPAIDDAGNVAFAWFDRGAARLQQVAGGLSQTIAFPGAAVIGAAPLLILAPVEPVAGAAGEVLFGAVLADGNEGILAAGAGGLRPIVLTGDPVGDGGAAVAAAPIALSPAVGPGGDVLFAGEAEGGAAILRASGRAAEFVVRAGDPIAGAARFASFLETRTQYLGAGPALAPGGLMTFDARVTGGGRGLFLRDRNGGLETIAMGGGTAPGGGLFADDVFSFHSVNASGTYAFLGTSGEPPDATIALFYGRRGEGPATRVAAVGPYQPRFAGASGASYAPVPPPSRVNRAGQVAFTFRNGDGSDVLACYDGASLHFLAAPGHPAGADDRIALIFTGSFFLGTALPPHLDETGGVLFGALTEGGDVGLYRARCAPGGGGAAERVIGAGDEAAGGRLSPFELQAFDADAAGRVAFQAVYDDEFRFGQFLREGGATRAVARPFDLVPDVGFLFAVTPRLALLADGGLAFGALPFGGAEAILVADPGPDPEPRLLAGRDTDSPDGGRFRDFQASGGPTSVAGTTARLASDGGAALAFAASTTAGPEGVFMTGAPANAPPVADAGPRQTVECAGPEGTEVLLDGRASADPDGDPLVWTWTGPFGAAGGPQPSVRLPLGSHRIRLMVSDGANDSEPAEVVVDVLDTRPPALALGASPAALWPPDGRMADVELMVEAADLCDAAPRLLLLSVVAGEPPMPGRPGPTVGGAVLGTDDRLIALRAERSGAGAGRTYTITYGAIDAADNAAMATATVVVPHDRRRDP